MKTIRIFISSPGDVAKERQRAREVVESLRRRYSRHFMLQPVLWEDLPLQSDMPFQQGIEAVLSEKGADIAIFILWSRLGSPLGQSIARPDGTPYSSGTEREYDLIVQARAASLEREGKARPDILVYTRRDDASFEETLRGTSTDKKDELIQQKKRVESFLAETFRDKETGNYLGAYFPFDRPVTFSQRLRTHLQDLLDQMAGESTDVIWDTDKQGPPFLGLEAFQPRHEAVFFGREEEILEARHALKEQARDGCAFLLLSGASGSGKSSLARAGILPAIVELEVDEQVAAWRSLILTPSQLGADPLLALVTSLAADEILPALREGSSTLPDLVVGLRKDPDLTFNLRIKDAFAKTAAKLDGSIRLLLVIDQLEELFTEASISAEDRTAFLAVLETFSRSGSIWVLATVRSDFYQQVQSEPVLVRMKSGHGQLDVLPPSPDALARVIEEPARLAGLAFEKHDGHSLSSRILKDAASHAELLPLVEFVLRELYENRTSNQQLTFAAYESLGGVEGALAKRANDTYSSLPGDAQESLASVLQALVSLGIDSENAHAGREKFVRQRAPMADFDAVPPAKLLVETFIAARLFTTCLIETTGEPAVTVAHESLLRVWSRAKAWADNNRAFLHTRARIATRIAEGSPLLKGDPLLETAKAYLLTKSSGFSAAQHKWIMEAVATATANERRANRRRRLAFATLSLLTLFAMASAVWAIKRERDVSIAKKSAEGLINSILYDLRDKLDPLGRIELLDDVTKQAEIYFRNNPSETLEALKYEATMWSNKGMVFVQLGDLNGARNAYEKSLKITERVALSDTTDATQGRLGQAYSLLAKIAERQGDLMAARKATEESLRINKRLADAYPNVFTNQNLGDTHVFLAGLAYKEGNNNDSIVHAQEGLRLFEILRQQDNLDVMEKTRLSAGYKEFAIILKDIGHPNHAANAAKYACELAQDLAKNDPLNQNIQILLADCYFTLGICLEEDDIKSARIIHEKGLAIANRLIENDPKNEIAIDLKYRAFYNIAAVAAVEHNYGEAVRISEQSLEFAVKRNDKDRLPLIYMYISWYLLHAKEFSKAEEAAEKGLVIDPNFFPLKSTLAHSHLFQGNYSKAESIYIEFKGNSIEDDFAKLRKSGLNHPDMEKIEKKRLENLIKQKL